MKTRSAIRRVVLTATLSVLLLSGCSSPQAKAAAAAQRFAQAYAAGDYFRARMEILEAVRFRDDVPDYWIALARTQLALRQFGGAYEAFSFALELDRTNIEAMQNLAEISLGIGRLDDADKHADQLLALNPDEIRGGLVKGYVALRRKKFADAERWADRILAKYPLEDPPLTLKAQAMFQSGRRKEAVEMVEKVIPIRGVSKPKLDTLIELYGKMGDRDGIERNYARYVELMPDDPSIKLRYAEELYRSGKSTGADTLLARMLANGELPERVADVMIEAGERSRDAAGIEQLAADAAPPVRLALARVALEKGYTKVARTLLEPFVGQAMSQTAAAATAMYAEAQYGEGQLDGAARLADQVIAFDEANPRALRVRAEVSLAKGNLNQALTDAAVLVRDQPTMAVNRTLLAKVHAARGNAQTAESTFREAFNDLPGNELVLADYVSFLTQRRQHEQASQVARDFTARYPSSRPGWKVLADACRAAGDAPCVAESMRRWTRLEMAQQAPQQPA